MKTVGIVSRSLNNSDAVRGIGFYTTRLLKALNALDLDINIEEVALEEAYKSDSIDLVHYPFFNFFTHSLPIFKSKKTVVTLHDVIPLEFPEHYPPGIKGGINLLLQKLSLTSVDTIITDSNSSVKNIIKYLSAPNEKIKLIYLAADNEFVHKTKPTNKFKLPKKFVLYVGDINYNKNIPNLVQACKLAQMPLVVVGKQFSQIDSLDLNHPQLSHLKGLDVSQVIKLGFVETSDLVDVYNLATVYCQPSFSEGFGLPVLEAINCQTPVVCSQGTSMTELVGPSGVYFDPNNVEEMAEKLRQTAKLSKDIIKWSQKFTWESTARQTVEVYKEIL